MKLQRKGLNQNERQMDQTNLSNISFDLADYKKKKAKNLFSMQQTWMRFEN